MPAFLWVVVIYVVVLMLHLAVPGRWVDGYVVDPRTGRPYRYHLNGPQVFALTIVAAFGACSSGLLSWDFLWLHRWEFLATACALGLLFTLGIVLTAPRVPGWSLGKELFLGRIENPQWFGGRLDAKMFLYLVGATMLELNVLSFAAHHHLTHPGDPSGGVVLYAVLFTFFLVEYLTFEEVHLYTYDFMAERVGFKLGWGCLVFYPFFYAVGLWALADAPNPHSSTAWLAMAGATFFSGWVLSRGANLQKFFFKRNPTAKAFRLLQPVALEANGRQVLVSGFWGLSRHINYLGEILMASGLTLALGYPLVWLAWLYPLYYVALLVPRQLDDDRRCAERYGPAWVEYQKRVPYRIVPYVY